MTGSDQPETPATPAAAEEPEVERERMRDVPLDRAAPEPETWEERPESESSDAARYEAERPPHHGT